MPLVDLLKLQNNYVSTNSLNGNGMTVETFL
jgi:hypothetical protein